MSQLSILSIPNDILYYIFGLCEISNLSKCRQICRFTNNLFTKINYCYGITISEEDRTKYIFIYLVNEDNESIIILEKLIYSLNFNYSNYLAVTWNEPLYKKLLVNEYFNIESLIESVKNNNNALIKLLFTVMFPKEIGRYIFTILKILMEQKNIEIIQIFINYAKEIIIKDISAISIFFSDFVEYDCIKKIKILNIFSKYILPHLYLLENLSVEEPPNKDKMININDNLKGEMINIFKTYQIPISYRFFDGYDEIFFEYYFFNEKYSLNFLKKCAKNTGILSTRTYILLICINNLGLHINQLDNMDLHQYIKINYIPYIYNNLLIDDFEINYDMFIFLSEHECDSELDFLFNKLPEDKKQNIFRMLCADTKECHIKTAKRLLDKNYVDPNFDDHESLISALSSNNIDIINHIIPIFRCLPSSLIVFTNILLCKTESNVQSKYELEKKSKIINNYLNLISFTILKYSKFEEINKLDELIRVYFRAFTQIILEWKIDNYFKYIDIDKLCNIGYQLCDIDKSRTQYILQYILNIEGNFDIVNILLHIKQFKFVKFLVDIDIYNIDNLRDTINKNEYKHFINMETMFNFEYYIENNKTNHNYPLANNKLFLEKNGYKENI